MQGHQDWAEHFSDVKEMSESTSAKIPAAVAVAAGFNWSGVVYMGTVPHPQKTIFGKSHGVSAVPGWKDAIKHINAGLDGSNDIGRGADTH